MCIFIQADVKVMTSIKTAMLVLTIFFVLFHEGEVMTMRGQHHAYTPWEPDSRCLNSSYRNQKVKKQQPKAWHENLAGLLLLPLRCCQHTQRQPWRLELLGGSGRGGASGAIPESLMQRVPHS